MINNTGKLIISLDFELRWGLRDHGHSNETNKSILGVWEVIPKMLNMFHKYEVKATFAVVGFLFAANKTEILKFSPEPKPKYINQKLSPYSGYLNLIGEDEQCDKYHFASELVNKIKHNTNHEIATHTFSHYYCLEEGQTKESFEADLLSAIEIAKNHGIKIKSIIFPRNQVNEFYLSICQKYGITSYRGNEKAWYYRAERRIDETLFKRVFRLIDSYINISGHNCYPPQGIGNSDISNIPSSRFLRPYSPKFKYIENLRLKRITKSMDFAAKEGLIYHLWWHPHNFGINQNENFYILEKILTHYKHLHTKFGFQSTTMREFSESLRGS